MSMSSHIALALPAVLALTVTVTRVSCAPVTYRYFKLEVHDSTDTSLGWGLNGWTFFDGQGAPISMSGTKCGSPPCCSASSSHNDENDCRTMAGENRPSLTHTVFEVHVSAALSTTGVGWIAHDFGSPQAVSAYSLFYKSLANSHRFITAWKLLGSNDNVDWAELSNIPNFDWASTESAKNYYVGFIKIELPNVTQQLLSDLVGRSSVSATPLSPCSAEDGCKSCRDGAFAGFDPDDPTRIIDAGGFCIVNQAKVCVDVYTRERCSADNSACPADVVQDVEPEYLLPVWYQTCGNTGRKVVMGPEGCEDRGVNASGVFAAV